MASISAGQSLAAYQRRPPDYGLVGWTFDPAVCSSTATVATAGTLQLQRVHVPVTTSITNIVMYLGTFAVGGTAGQNFAGLWTSAGAQIGITADQTAAWGSATLKTMALVGGPYTVAAGDVYIGWYWNAATSGPGWARAGTISGSLMNASLASPNMICATADTGLTTTPPPTFGAQTTNSYNWWAALS